MAPGAQSLAALHEVVHVPASSRHRYAPHEMTPASSPPTVFTEVLPAQAETMTTHVPVAQTAPVAQSVFCWQLVSHAVALWHAKLFRQGKVWRLPHPPSPLQTPVVSAEPVQLTPHEMLAPA
jgi:hypothetical protein